MGGPRRMNGPGFGGRRPSRATEMELVKRRFAVHRFWTAVLCLLALSVEARAQSDWPNRPIKIIVSQAAGAAPDIVCRYLADWLSAGVGQQSSSRTGPAARTSSAPRP